jgi:hypothetical protein
MKKRINQIINRVKQWRIIGYIAIIKTMYEIHDVQQATIESFLLVILGELSARNLTKKSSKDMKEEILGTHDINDNSAHIDNIKEKE